MAILGEAFLLNVPQPHLFSIIGIGIVVILTGYLFFDSIWEYIAGNKKKRDLLWSELIKQETEKWDSRYTELLNIQKATYAALKKSNARLGEQIEDLTARLTQITQVQNEEKIIEKAELEIEPLYDDPNAALSADEIKQLFDNYGK